MDRKDQTGCNVIKWFWELIWGGGLGMCFCCFYFDGKSTNSRFFPFPIWKHYTWGRFSFSQKLTCGSSNWAMCQQSKGKGYTIGTGVWRQDWSQSGQAFSPTGLQGMRDEDSFSTSGFRIPEQKGVEWEGESSSDKHHNSLVVKTEIK